MLLRAVARNASNKRRIIIGLFVPAFCLPAVMEVLVQIDAKLPSARCVTRLLLDYVPTLGNNPQLCRMISQEKKLMDFQFPDSSLIPHSVDVLTII